MSRLKSQAQLLFYLFSNHGFTLNGERCAPSV